MCVCLGNACAGACVCIMMHEVCLEGPSVCLVCATWEKCVKHIINDQNKLNKVKQVYTQKLEFTWIQFNTKMSLGHSVKHLTCNKVHKWWKMHEHSEKCLNTCSNYHMGPTQKQSQQNFTKTKNLNPIFENPQFLNPNLNFCIISENMKKMFRKTYLEVIL